MEFCLQEMYLQEIADTCDTWIKTDTCERTTEHNKGTLIVNKQEPKTATVKQKHSLSKCTLTLTLKKRTLTLNGRT